MASQVQVRGATYNFLKILFNGACIKWDETDEKFRGHPKGTRLFPVHHGENDSDSRIRIRIRGLHTHEE
jgi:hypothetical protein